MAKKRKVVFHTTIQGGTIKHMRVLTPETALERMIRKVDPRSRRNSRGTTPFELLSWEIQVAYRKRAISRLLQLLYSVKNPIRVFFSLNLDNRLRAVDINKFKKFLAKFFRLLLAEYPDCWFIYKIEWTHKANFHLHLLGALSFPGSIPESMLRRHEKIVKQLWDKACDQEGSDICTVKMTHAVPEHRGYMAKRAKLKDDIACMRLLNGRRMFGKVNPGNIKYHDTINDTLSEKQFYDLVRALIENDKDKKGKAFIEYYIKQARHEFGAIRGFDSKDLLRTYNAVKNGKEARYES